MATAKADYFYRRSSLYPKQEAAMFDERRYSCIEANTKSGKTVSGIIWLGEKALTGFSGQNYWWVAPIFSQAKIAFDRMLDAMTREARTPNLNEMRINLINGTRIWFKGADDPNSLYGEDVYGVVVDEASRMKEQSWHAIRSTLTATHGQARLIGNVHGRRNWFYKMCRRAEAGERDMAYHRITWRDAVEAGVLDVQEIEDARAQLPANVFQELFEAEAAVDGSNPFGVEAIRRCIITEFSKNPIASWGWDLAKRQDWTVGIALDRKGRIVRLVRFQASWHDTRARILAETGGKPALVDATGVGDPIVEDLQRSGGNFEAYVFTSRSKQHLMEGLAVAIQHGEIGLTAGVIINELESFEYEYTATGVRYSAPEGMHDDCVCAAALAVRRLGPRGEFRSQRVGAAAPSGFDSAPQDGPGSKDFDDRIRVGGGWEQRTGLI